MKKRITGALLVLCLCLTLLPGAAEAAYEPPTEVSQVTLSVTPPAVGGALTAPTVDSNKPYFIDSDSLFDSNFADTFYWTRVAAEGCAATAGYLYEEGGQTLVNNSWYQLHARLKLDYGYSFAEQVTAAVPGAASTEVERYRDDTVYVSAWFKVGNPADRPAQVSTVTISGVPTERAETIQAWTDAIQNAAVSEGCRIYDAALQKWNSEESCWNYCYDSDSTESGAVYGVILHLNTLPGYVFDETVTAAVNGSAAEVAECSMDEVEVFVPFGSIVVNKVEVKSATWPIDGNTIRKDADNFTLYSILNEGRIPYTLKSARFQIKDGESYRDLKDEETIFSESRNYRVIAELEAKDYASFADSVTGDFNGTSGTECQTSDGGKACTVTRTCAVYDPVYTYSTDDPNTHINSVTIHQNDPQPGEKYADGVYAPAGSRTMLVGVNGSYSWHEVPCVGSTEGIKKLTNTDTFEAGKVYWYSLTLRNADGYRFGDGFTVFFKQMDGTDSNYAMMQRETDTEKRKVYNLWYTVGDVTQTPITAVAVTGPAYQNGAVDISDPGAFRANAPVTLRSLTYNNNYLSFTLLPQSGHYFGRTVTVTYNGKEARVSDGFFSSFDTKYIGVSYYSEPATPVTVTGITAQDKVYDGTAAATLTGGTLSGVAEGDTVALDFSEARAEFDSRDVGNDKSVTVKGTLKLTGADAHKYALTPPELTGLKADITPCAAFDDATNKNQIIYVGEDSFAAPRFTGVGGEEVTGTLRYTLSDGKTEAEIPEMLRALKAGDSLNIPYTFTASGNYSGEKTGTITVTAQERPSFGGGSHTSSYPVAVSGQTQNGSVTVDRRSAGRGDTVTITVKPDSGYVLETLTAMDKDGSELKLTDKGSGKYTFTMPGSRVEVKATFMEDNAVLNFFYDVPNDSFYYEAVKWAVGKNITSGVGNNLFAPDQPCTRAQIVTFLWRAAGSPAPESTTMPFTDVPAGSYYHSAVLWAIENGVTVGTSADAFSPDADCTRAQIVTFLWRAEGSPAAGSSDPFTDVAADAYYADAVLWAVKEGITNGSTATTFSPDVTCTRAQAVTFLYRCMK